MNEVVNYKKKIAFFVKKGLDSFLQSCMDAVSTEYETKKIIVTEYSQIEEGMKWADLCWFEWCDELVSYGSHLPLALDKKIVCRLHSYEAFSEYPNSVNWTAVDRILFVSPYIRDFVVQSFGIAMEKTVVIPNGIDLAAFTFKKREKGFRIAYVGYINYKKGPMMLLHTFKAIYDQDARYKLFIAGVFQDHRDILYFKQMIRELGLENSIFLRRVAGKYKRMAGR